MPLRSIRARAPRHLGLRAILPLLLAAGAAGAAWATPAAAAPTPTTTYRLPYELDRSFRCTQSRNGGTSHTGNLAFAVDFGMPEGTTVCAARGGRVIRAVDDETRNGKDGRYGGTGNHVKIDHGDGTVGVYMHLQPEGALVEEGDWVVQGDTIARSGNTGHSTGPHLHFQVSDRTGASIAFAFADVATDAGVPAAGQSYTSGNAPGIPGPLRDRLTALEQARRLATTEGAPGLVYEACERIGKVKLDVPYPPQREARDELERLAGAATALGATLRAESTARFDEAARRILLERPGCDGLPDARALRDLARELSDDPRFAAIERALRTEVRLRERYLKGLRAELFGSLKSAHGHYRYVAARAEGDLAERVKARLAAVEARAQALAAERGGS